MVIGFVVSYQLAIISNDSVDSNLMIRECEYANSSRLLPEPRIINHRSVTVIWKFFIYGIQPHLS